VSGRGKRYFKFETVADVRGFSGVHENMVDVIVSGFF
jgi:hypothetical protein